MVSLTLITRERRFRTGLCMGGRRDHVGVLGGFVIFLAEPRLIVAWWPLPTVDQEDSLLHPLAAALIDLGLIALFELILR